MIESRNEVGEAAQRMINRYGDAALKEIDLRILELQYHDRPEETELWRKIRERVELLVADPDSGSIQ